MAVDLTLASDVAGLLGADTIMVDRDGVTLWRDARGWTLLPVLECIPCQGDRPVVPLAGDTYRCASCGQLSDPSGYRSSDDE